jgi:hypothetical protein
MVVWLASTYEACEVEDEWDMAEVVYGVRETSRARELSGKGKRL